MHLSNIVIMVVLIIFHKIKSLLLVLINLFRRALCCFRKQRRNSFDAVPLTHVGVVSSNQTEEQNWEWNDANQFENNPKPKTIQDHIDLYRKKTMISHQQQEEIPSEEQLNFFEDMTPQITRQTKIVVNTEKNTTDRPNANRLNIRSDDMITCVETGDLREWEENSGWEGETLDWDIQEALREKKRLEREKRMWEQQQKRQEKLNRSLGARVS